MYKRVCVCVAGIFGDYSPSISSILHCCSSIHPSPWIFSQRSVCERQKSYLDGVSTAHCRAHTHTHVPEPLTRSHVDCFCLWEVV